MVQTSLLNALKMRHLRLLVALGEMRSVHRAAQNLGMTQPGASRLMADVEALVGAPLFDRLPRGIAPNPLGEILIRRARASLLELDRAREELAAVAAGSAGTVAVGAVTGPAAGPIARAISVFNQTAAGIRISVEVSTSGPLVAGLLDRRFDFVVARIPPDVNGEDLDYHEIKDEELGFLVRDTHPLLKEAPPDLEIMRRAPWVLQPPGTLLRQEVDSLFQRAGLPSPTQIIDTASVMMTLALVAQNDMIAALSREVAASVLQGSRFHLLRTALSVPRIAIRRYGLIRLRDKPLSPAADAFYKQVRETLSGVA